MTTVELRDILDTLSLSKDEYKTDVLTAVLTCQKRDKGATFNTIIERLKTGSRKRVNESLIYRYLSELESERFISINRTEYYHEYVSGLDFIHDAVRKRKLEVIDELRDALKEVEDEQDFFMKTDMKEVTEALVEIFTGKRLIPQTRFVHNFPGISRLIASEIFSSSQRNDKVRITIGWSDGRFEDLLVKEQILEHLLQKGVIVQVLIPHDYSVSKMFKDHLIQRSERGEDIDIRIRSSPHKTYRTIGKNADSIVLVVSNTPLTATFVPKDVNPILVDDAISTFDREFEHGKVFYELAR